MGLDATVLCNCYREGRTTALPFADLVVLDEDGYLGLSVPYVNNQANYRLFWKWKETCCEHPRMEYGDEHIANWSGYRAFQEALKKADWQNFPTLHAELPEGNGGVMSAVAAAQALQELEYFKNQADLGSNTFLIETATGETLHEYIASYDGLFIYAGSTGLHFGFDQQGFFIVTAQEPITEVFRARFFEQRLLEPELNRNGEKGQVAYISLESEQQFVCTVAISKNSPWPDGQKKNAQGRVHFDYPTLLHVETRKINASEFTYILEPLTRIFQAAVKTGNPVRWC